MTKMLVVIGYPLQEELEMLQETISGMKGNDGVNARVKMHTSVQDHPKEKQFGEKIHI